MSWKLYRIAFPNGKLYFGITSKTIEERWHWHCKQNKTRMHLPVYNAIRKYGKENCAIEVLVLGEETYILDLEIRIIAQFDTRNRLYGYNVSLGGTKSPMLVPEISAKVAKKTAFRMKGSKATPEARANMKIAQNRPEQCEKRREAIKRYWAIPENHIKRKMLASSRRPKSAITKAKLSASGKLAWSKSHRLKLNDESIRCIQAEPNFHGVGVMLAKAFNVSVATISNVRTKRVNRL